MYRVKSFVLIVVALGAAALVAQQVADPIKPSAPPAATAATPQAAPTEPPPEPSSYPTRPPGDPAMISRGHQVFSANCSFCHGSDARGGEGGPNLIHSELVLNDKNGELIMPVVLNGRLSKGMPKFDLASKDIVSIAAFLHNVPVGGRAETTGTVNSLVGDAKAGEAFFNGAGKCSSCHSAAGDLNGIAKIYPDPRMLQSAMISGEKKGEFPWKTVTVTFPGGKTMQGRLWHLDDFSVALTDSNGNYHSYTRNGDLPKVVVKNPLQPHLDMMPTLQDDDIHNLTAYLVTLK